MAAQTFAERWAAFSERCGREAEYQARAWRIVNRVMPLGRVPHGFYEPEAFFDAAVLRGQRKRLQLRIFARLRAKAEGGEPYLAAPAFFRPGDALFDVARELELEAAAR